MALLFDCNGNLSFATPDWENASGRAASTALGIQWMSSIHPDDKSFIVSTMKRAIEAKQSVVMKFRLVKDQGHQNWVRLSLTPAILHDSHEYIGQVGTLKVLDNGVDLAEAVAEPPMIGRQLHDGAKTAAIEAVADYTIHARSLADQAGERVVVSILDLALLEIGYSLAKRSKH